MTSSRSDAGNSLNRRTVIRGGLLAGVGLATAGGAVAATTRAARASDLSTTAVFAGQSYNLTSELGWAQCLYCGVAFYPTTSSGGSSSGGYCAYGMLGTGDNTNMTPHRASTSGGTATSGTYCVPLTKSTAPSMQGSWTHCTQCKGLFDGTGECPADDPQIAAFNPFHTGGGSSRAYDMMFASGSGWSPGNTALQARWNWCDFCNSLYYTGAVRQSCSGNGGQFRSHQASTNNSGVINYYLFKFS